MSSHPDSVSLLAFLDGELNPLRSWRVRRHVEGCWSCRGRPVDFQNSIAEVGRELTEGFDKTAIARARWNFRESAARVEAEMHRAPNARTLYASFVAAGALVCLPGRSGFISTGFRKVVSQLL